MSSNDETKPDRSVWPHFVVVGSLAVLLFAEGPQLKFFSGIFGMFHPLTDDPLGGGVRAAGVLCLAAYLGTLGLKQRQWLMRLRAFVIGYFVMFFAVLPTFGEIGVRQVVGLRLEDGRLVSVAHDGGVLQTEAALDFLLAGESPYSADYRNTQMAEGADSDPALWEELGMEENPAFDFFPYPPGVLLVSVPIKAAIQISSDWYDQRLVYLLAYLLLILTLSRVTANKELVGPVLALVALNPLLVFYLPPGRNDILFVTSLAVTIVAWSRHRWGWAGLCLALACSFKQFAWLLVPLFLAHTAGATRTQAGIWSPGLKKGLLGLIVTSVVIWLPFLAWDGGSLFNDLVLSQGALYPLRVRGFGVTDILVFLDLVQTNAQALPLLPLMAVAGLGTLAWGCVRSYRSGDLGTALRFYGVVLFITLFFGRYFAANHFGAVVTVWLFAALVSGGWIRSSPRAAPGDDEA